jgi:hypothetical protein
VPKVGTTVAHQPTTFGYKPPQRSAPPPPPIPAGAAKSVAPQAKEAS